MAKILVIDDDPHCREMLRARLKKEKHEVLEANDGEEGLDFGELEGDDEAATPEKSDEKAETEIPPPPADDSH